LLIPLFLATGAFYLQNRVDRRQEIIVAERYEQEVRIADERAKQAILDSYLDNMQVLLLDKGLREASENSEVRSVARAITTKTIKELDPERNDLLIRFLRESNLIQASDNVEGTPATKKPSLLAGLNLRGVDLRGVDLSSANLTGTNLIDANLYFSNLSQIDLKLVPNFFQVAAVCLKRLR